MLREQFFQELDKLPPVHKPCLYDVELYAEEKLLIKTPIIASSKPRAELTAKTWYNVAGCTTPCSHAVATLQNADQQEVSA